MPKKVGPFEEQMLGSGDTEKEERHYWQERGTMRKQMRETKKKSNLKLEKSIKGVITARKCECCSHHEIGITTDVLT